MNKHFTRTKLRRLTCDKNDGKPQKPWGNAKKSCIHLFLSFLDLHRKQKDKT